MILGASLSHLALGREARFVEGMCGMVQDAILPGYWGYEATQASLGDLYAWFFRTGLPAELEREASRRGLTPAEFITTEAWRLKPGESGLLALDWWNGNRSILMDADLSGVLVGLTLSTRPEEIYRALMEATAFGARAILEAFDAQGLATRDIVACGGIAEKSPVVLQIFADVTGRPIRLPRCFQASGLGAALHATVASGYYQDLPAAVSRMTGLLDRAYLPNPAAQAVYDRLYTDYRLLHDYFGRGGNDVLKRLRTLRHDAGHV